MNEYLLKAMNWENLTISELDENLESIITISKLEDHLVDFHDFFWDILHLCRYAVHLRTSFSILESHVNRPSTGYYNDTLEFTKKNMNFHGFKDTFNINKDGYFHFSCENEEDYLNKIKEMNSD